jgi:hypothetical protein
VIATALHPAEAPVSPELALVDPDLRSRALASLPRVEAFEFLRLREVALPVARPEPARLAAALAYLLVALVRTCAFNLCVFASVALVVLLLNLLA